MNSHMKSWFNSLILNGSGFSFKSVSMREHILLIQRNNKPFFAVSSLPALWLLCCCCLPVIATGQSCCNCRCQVLLCTAEWGGLEGLLPGWLACCLPAWLDACRAAWLLAGLPGWLVWLAGCSGWLPVATWTWNGPRQLSPGQACLTGRLRSLLDSRWCSSSQRNDMSCTGDTHRSSQVSRFLVYSKLELHHFGSLHCFYY